MAVQAAVSWLRVLPVDRSVPKLAAVLVDPRHRAKMHRRSGAAAVVAVATAKVAMQFLAVQAVAAVMGLHRQFRAVSALMVATAATAGILRQPPQPGLRLAAVGVGATKSMAATALAGKGGDGSYGAC